jgi:uncharacterized MnhB-related membrane protein
MKTAIRLFLAFVIVYFGAHLAIAQRDTWSAVVVVLGATALAYLVDVLLAGDVDR